MKELFKLCVVDRILFAVMIVWVLFTILYLTVLIAISANFKRVEFAVRRDSTIVKTCWWLMTHIDEVGYVSKEEMSRSLKAECSRRYFGFHYGKQLRMLWSAR